MTITNALLATLATFRSPLVDRALSLAGSGRHSTVQRPGQDAIVALWLGDAEVTSWPLERSGRGDLALIDELARLQLAARRMGYAIRLRETCEGLLALLDLVGLKDLVTDPPSGQVKGEVEGREKLGVDEVVVPDDPVA